METSSKVKIYRGQEIKEQEVQKIIKHIDKNRNLRRNGIAFDDKNENEDFDDCDFCVLGTGWYLFYRVENHRVTIESFQSIDNKEKSRHALEMIAVFKELLLAYNDYTFSALLNKNSVRLYKLVKEKGYIKELYYKADKYDSFIDCRFRVSSAFIEKYAQNKKSAFQIKPIK